MLKKGKFMYAIVEITGVQTRVSSGERLRVPLLKGNSGEVVSFDKVLLAGDGDKIKIGTPYIGGKVEVTIVGHDKEDKVYVFKKKRRKGYRRFKGHKQKYTLVQVTGMEIDGLETYRFTGTVEIPSSIDFDESLESSTTLENEMSFENTDIEEEAEEIVEKPARKSRKKTS